jgi:hypothetical protein
VPDVELRGDVTRLGIVAIQRDGPEEAMTMAGALAFGHDNQALAGGVDHVPGGGMLNPLDQDVTLCSQTNHRPSPTELARLGGTRRSMSHRGIKNRDERKVDLISEK